MQAELSPADQFRAEWAALQEYARETRRLWEQKADEMARELAEGDLDDVLKASIEDQVERNAEHLKERAERFTDRLLELRSFAAEHDLEVAVRYIDHSLGGRPRST